MNDIAKTQTQTRLNKAIESEGLKINEVAECLGIKATYISMIRNEKHWPNCSAAAWESVLKWVNSGQSLKEYSEKHGKVLPTKHSEVAKDEIEALRKNLSNYKPDTIKKEPRVKVRPEALERRQKEINKEARPSKGKMIDMLLEEKDSLKAKIDAIDVLLNHYIS